jgi:23S rRNA pseudouridine955/2504/2580 synthase
MKVFQYKINNLDIGLSLLDLLSNRFKYLSREEWKSEINEKKSIQVCYQDVNEFYIIRNNDIVTFRRESYNEPEVDRNVSTLYESENLLVVNKSGNLPVHPAGRYKENTLLTILQKDYENSQLFVVHRLDRETSGIQIFAKNSQTASVIQREFENRNIYKEYIVYIHGNFPIHVNANGFLFKDQNSLVRKKRKFSYTYCDNSETSTTDFYLLEKFKGISKVKAIPKTGRTHQIRATLKSLGYPIYGDKLYGIDEENFLKFIEGDVLLNFPNRQALHAFKIRIPASKFYPNLEIIAEEPDDLKKIQID